MKRYFFIAIVAVFMLIFIAFSDKYISSVKVGLQLYAVCVLPALFPFFFFSKILTNLNVGSDIGKLLDKPLKTLYNAPNISGYIMIISMLSGYPVGAKLIADCYNNNLITYKQAKTISTFTSSSGPLFVVGSVGVAMLSDKKAGFVLLICHYLATILNGLIYRGKKCKSDNNSFCTVVDYDNLLSDSMMSAIFSILIVGGYIAIFNMVLDVFWDIKLIHFLSTVLENISIDARLSGGFFSALIEMTKGCLMLSQSGFSLKIILPIMCFAISFGGLSVTMQSLTYLSQCKISIPFYFATKFTQALLAFFICLLCCAVLY